MLRAEFAESREGKCRRLASELSAINQDPAKSVEEFAFRYKKLLHQLEKLGEKIGKDCPTFVISQFISKVKPAISQQLVVKASDFSTLEKAVEAARRVELAFQTPPIAVNTNSSLDDYVSFADSFRFLYSDEITRSEYSMPVEGLLQLRITKSS